jgi:hypothetical protein
MRVPMVEAVFSDALRRSICGTGQLRRGLDRAELLGGARPCLV